LILLAFFKFLNAFKRFQNIVF